VTTGRSVGAVTAEGGTSSHGGAAAFYGTKLSRSHGPWIAAGDEIGSREEEEMALGILVQGMVFGVLGQGIGL